MIIFIMLGLINFIYYCNLFKYNSFEKKKYEVFSLKKQYFIYKYKCLKKFVKLFVLI